MTHTASRLLIVGYLCLALSTVAQAQQTDHTSFDISNVYNGLDANASQVAGQQVMLAPTWWDTHVSQSQRREMSSVPADINTLMYLALKYSNQIRIAAEDPVIRETAIAEADSNFDWVKYLNTSWNDTSEPVTNSLTAGGNQSRLNDHILQASAGVRRNTRYGGQLDISQRFGWQNNNSNFFIPADQASGQFTVSYSHPLMRGRGYAYNTSLVVLAKIDSHVAESEFKAELQNHLLEIARAYWGLYQERAILAQQVRLFLKTQDIVQQLSARQAIDAQRTQLITASAALESRRSSLIRARTAVINAETRLRGMINAPELGNSDQMELLPIETPSLNFYPAQLQAEIQTAIQNRPEVQAAIKQVQAGSTRLGIAEHEMLPVLNLITQGYVSGLRGNSDFGGTFADQFSEGAPSYSLGIQYEMPICNRLAIARKNRRQIELRQLERQYAQALTAVETEVDIAVRELFTAFREIQARSRALSAAESEATTIRLRWTRMIDGAGNSGLNLESLLDAQERVSEAEREYVSSILLYNLSVINLKKANGTLLTSEQVSISKADDEYNGSMLILDKLNEVGAGNYIEPATEQSMILGTSILQPAILQPLENARGTLQLSDMEAYFKK